LQTSDAVGTAAVQLGPDAKAMTSLMKNELGFRSRLGRAQFVYTFLPTQFTPPIS
jgi:hypothetical protein